MIYVSVDYEKCTGCEACVVVCPRDVFRIEGEKAEVADMARCNACCSCVEACPTEAIYVDACDK